MYRIFKTILHLFQGDFKILVKSDIFEKNLWLISWSLLDDQGGITSMFMPSLKTLTLSVLSYFGRTPIILGTS